ncbi:hypothetical protein ACJJTC_014089 [Scirpophaga incertulas]
MTSVDSPVPLADIEAVLAWVDSYKLSRVTKKINRDFSDAVLLAEILNVHYPKLVEMHNYPPRNSHALKLNNWMTLNRKVLKKLRLNLCCNTMERLANSEPGLVERVLIMVKDKIRRDEELNKSTKESEQNMSSGGSYYEAYGDDEHVLVVPIKTRINGILETVQQKVVSYDLYQAVKEEFKDAKESVELLKQKVDHLDSMLKIKDERIEELQKQLDRKQARRKEAEVLQNSLSVPFEISQSKTFIAQEPSKIPISQKASKIPITQEASKILITQEASKIPLPINDSWKTLPVPFSIEVMPADSVNNELINEIDNVKSDVFKDAPCYEPIVTNILSTKRSATKFKETPNNITNACGENVQTTDISDLDDFLDSSPDSIVTIEEDDKAGNK